ncbi:MAG: GspH/FimT family pseudopilin [Firmicutes bacterium]|nr:GspH/FimT family pseudopilin [Bacillota bacterium]
MRNNKGFTLIEIIAVLALMALAIGMAMPIFAKTLVSVQLQTDAQKMASLLRMTRQQAMTSGQPKTVVFYPASGKYKVNGSTSYYLHPGIGFIGATTFTTKQGGQPICGFSPTGVPSSGGTVTLGNGYERRYVIVNPVAGRVRISESPPAEW